MNYHSILETNHFKVKEAKKFKEHLEAKLEGEQIYIGLEKEGVKIILNDWHAEEEFEIFDFIKDNIQEGYFCDCVTISYGSKGHDVGYTHAIINSLGIKFTDNQHQFTTIVESFYPRKMKAKESVYHKESGRWLEKGDEYLVLEERRGALNVEFEDGYKVFFPQEDLENV